MSSSTKCGPKMTLLDVVHRWPVLWAPRLLYIQTAATCCRVQCITSFQPGKVYRFSRNLSRAVRKSGVYTSATHRAASVSSHSSINTGFSSIRIILLCAWSFTYFIMLTTPAFWVVSGLSTSSGLTDQDMGAANISVA